MKQKALFTQKMAYNTQKDSNPYIVPLQ